MCKSKFGLNRIFSVKFDEIDTPTEKERAEINEIQARTDATLVQAGVVAPDEVRQKLINSENSGYNGIDEEFEEMPDDFQDTDNGGSSNEQNPFSMDKEWNESDHPRKENGQFGEGGSSSKSDKEQEEENQENINLVKKLEKLAKELKSPKPIDEVLKKEGEIVIMKGSEPFEADEINYSISQIVPVMSPEEKENGYAVRHLNGFYIHLKYDKNGKHEMGKYRVSDKKYD